MNLHWGEQLGETQEGAVLLPVRCFQGKGKTVGEVSVHKTQINLFTDWLTLRLTEFDPWYSKAVIPNLVVLYLTLNALDFTPLDLRRLKLALRVVSLLGSMGSLISLLSDRLSSSRFGSLEKAPSSISLIMFPLRLILFNVSENRGDQKEKNKHCSFGFGQHIHPKITNIN